MKHLLTLCLTAALHAQPHAAEPQSWTASDGRVMQAKFIKLNGESVVFEKDGTQFVVAFAKLAAASVEQAKKLGGAVPATPSLVSVAGKPAAKPDNNVGILKAGQFIPPPNQPGRSGYIPLVHLRQEKNLCVPTSACIVLQHSGKAVVPRELKALTRGKKYDPTAPFEDFTFTFFPELLLGVSTLGLTWHTKAYEPTKEGVESGIKEIIQAIDAGNPVIIDTSLYGSHTFVVAGYDDTARNLIIMDPNIAAPGLRLISYDNIEAIWTSHKTGFNKRATIFTAPKT